MSFRIEYHPLVKKLDIPKIDLFWLGELRVAIEEKLVTNPGLYGKPLHHSLRGYRKLRVGDFRIIFYVSKGIVRIMMIGHRSTVYKIIQKRLSRF